MLCPSSDANLEPLAISIAEIYTFVADTTVYLNVFDVIVIESSIFHYGSNVRRIHFVNEECFAHLLTQISNL